MTMLPKQRNSLTIVLQAIEMRLVEAIKEDVADGFADAPEDHHLRDLPPLLRAAAEAAEALLIACRAMQAALVPRADGGVDVIGANLPRAAELTRDAIAKAEGDA